MQAKRTARTTTCSTTMAKKMMLRKALFAAVFLPLSSWTIVSQWMLMSQVSSGVDSNAASVTVPKKSEFRRKAIDTGTTKTKAAMDTNEPPLFILHVGPPKTGTSTLQAFAATHEKMLKEDNIHYLGHYGKRDDLNMHEFSNLCRTCEGKKDCECNKKWEEFSKLVNHHYSENHNVMVSDETFYRYKKANDEKMYLWDQLVPLTKKWRVRVVFTYRRYFEWVPSTYHQSYNPLGKKRKDARESWPDEDGRAIPSFPDFVDTFLAAETKQPPALKKKWDDHFSDVWVFNMHEEGSFLRNFFCKMVPEASGVCDLLRSQNVELTHNPSSGKILHYDMLSTEAYARGMVKKGLSRTHVNKAVRKQSAHRGLKTMSDFPLKCLTKKQADLFLKKSLEMEAEMVPKFYATPNGEEALKSKFAEAMKTEKFCSVDVDRVLKDEKWKKFFKNLEASEA